MYRLETLTGTFLYSDMHVSIFRYSDLNVSIIIHNFPCLWRYAVCRVCSSIEGIHFRDLRYTLQYYTLL